MVELVLRSLPRSDHAQGSPKGFLLTFRCTISIKGRRSVLIGIVDHFALALASEVKQRLDVAVVELTTEIDRLLDPHADALTKQLFRPNCGAELTGFLAGVGDLDQPALDPVRR